MSLTQSGLGDVVSDYGLRVLASRCFRAVQIHGSISY